MSIKETHNLQKYKNAKVYVEHLADIHRIIDLAIKALSYYEAYHVASSTMSSLRAHKEFAAAQLNSQRKILKNKGKV